MTKYFPRTQKTKRKLEVVDMKQENTNDYETEEVTL
jgi:hypothetical protein